VPASGCVKILVQQINRLMKLNVRRSWQMQNSNMRTEQPLRLGGTVLERNSMQKRQENNISSLL
jgi:hypothetical protein